MIARNPASIIAALLVAATTLPAATFTVSSLNDSGSNTLRQAILDANAAPGTDSIEFSVNGTITLATNLPAITSDININGPGVDQLTVSGANAYRVFTVQSGATSSFNNFTIGQGMVAEFPSQVNPVSVTRGAGISNAGSLKLLNCKVRDCQANYNQGAGIYNAGQLELVNSMITNCTALGGGIDSQSGGGIYNVGTVVLARSTIAYCRSHHGPGDGIYNGGALVMSNSVITHCTEFLYGDGGGVCNEGTAVINNCMLDHNSGYWGGAILNNGMLSVTNSTLSANSSHEGGGLISFSGNAVLVGCTISDNKVYDQGGGVVNCGNMQLLNCTIARNGFWPIAGNYAAAISDKFNYKPNGVTSLKHCTVISNFVVQAKNEVVVLGSFSAMNSILGDCKGTLISGGHNLLVNTTNCVITSNIMGNLLGVDPLLGPLQDNGGPTWTLALLPGSPAIDQVAAGLPTDQRGYVRPSGPLADIGAFEFAAPAPTALVSIPVLQIIRTGSDQVTLLWPSSSTLFVLQQKPALANGVWDDVQVAPQDDGTTTQVTLPASGESQFFRLRPL